MELTNLFQSDRRIHPDIRVKPISIKSLAATSAVAIQADAVKLSGEALLVGTGH
jgi:hypothetical protein